MMQPRGVAALAAVALLVLAAGLWLASGGPAARAGVAVLPQLEAHLNDITRLRIESQGNAVTLVRGAEGWRVEERDFRADPGKLRRLLVDLAKLHVIEEKTSDPANYARLGVEEPGPGTAATRVVASGADSEFGLIVGKVADSTSVYVRLPDSAQSLLAAPQITAGADPKQWIDTALIDLPADRVESVAVTPATGPAWQASRDAATAPLELQGLPKGSAQRSPDAVTPVAAVLGNLQFEDVRAAPAERSEAATDGAPLLRVRSFDGVEIELKGRTEGERHFIRGTARSSGAASQAEAAQIAGRLAGFEFELPRYRYEALFRPLADFT